MGSTKIDLKEEPSPSGRGEGVETSTRSPRVSYPSQDAQERIKNEGDISPFGFLHVALGAFLTGFGALRAKSNLTRNFLEGLLTLGLMVRSSSSLCRYLQRRPQGTPKGRTDEHREEA